MIRTIWLQTFWLPGIFIKKMVRLSTLSRVWIILMFTICKDVVFLQPKKIINENFSKGSTSVNRAQGKSFSVFSSKCLTPPLLPPLPSVNRVLVPEAAVLQGSPAHHVSPLIQNKPPEHTAQDDERSATKQLVKRNSFSSVLPSKHRPPSISRYPEAPDAQPTTTATDAPSTSVSRPLPVSPSQGTSYVDVIENLLRPLTWFTDHYSQLLNGTPSNSTLYTTQEGKY